MAPGVITCPVCKGLIAIDSCVSLPVACNCGYVDVPKLITIVQYRGSKPLGAELEANAEDLLLKVNSLLQELGIVFAQMTSGFRSPEHNLAVGGKPQSNHMRARAIDLADDDLKLRNMLMVNLDKLKKRGMAMEDPAYCVTNKGNRWIHLQSCLPKSGKTVFIP